MSFTIHGPKREITPSATLARKVSTETAISGYSLRMTSTASDTLRSSSAGGTSAAPDRDE